MDKKKIAQVVSLGLYPAITGTIFIFLLFFGTMGLSLQSLSLATIYTVLTTLIPVLILKLLVRSGKISDWEMVLKSQRKLFFQAVSPSFLAAFFFLFLAKVSFPLFQAGVAVMVLAFAYYLISPIYKMSLHVGSMAFITTSLGLVVDKRFYFLLPLVFLLVWARWQLGKHTLSEALLGGLIGGGVPIAIFRLVV